MTWLDTDTELFGRLVWTIRSHQLVLDRFGDCFHFSSVPKQGPSGYEVTMQFISFSHWEAFHSDRISPCFGSLWALPDSDPSDPSARVSPISFSSRHESINPSPSATYPLLWVIFAWLLFGQTCHSFFSDSSDCPPPPSTCIQIHFASPSESLRPECSPDGRGSEMQLEDDDDDVKKCALNEDDLLKAFLEEDFNSQHYDSIWEVFRVPMAAFSKFLWPHFLYFLIFSAFNIIGEPSQSTVS